MNDTPDNADDGDKPQPRVTTGSISLGPVRKKAPPPPAGDTSIADEQAAKIQEQVKSAQLDAGRRGYEAAKVKAQAADADVDAVIAKATSGGNLVMLLAEQEKFDEAGALYADLVEMASAADVLPEVRLERSRAAFNLFVINARHQREQDAVAMYGELSEIGLAEKALPDERLRLAKASVNLVADLGEEKQVEEAENVYENLAKLAVDTGGAPETNTEIAILDAWWRGVLVMSNMFHEIDPARIDALIDRIENTPELAKGAAYIEALEAQSEEADAGNDQQG